jgi:hypothetical protein
MCPLLAPSLTYGRCRPSVDIEGIAVIKRTSIGHVPQVWPARSRFLKGFTRPLRFPLGRPGDFKIEA